MRNIRVMLVDDQQMVRDGLRELIGAEAGMEVMAEAADGESAVATARHARPDVIVMDISMPKMNGIDATRHITAHSPQVKVIALSLEDNPFTRQAMQAAGAAAYLTKDKAFEALRGTIRALVAQADRHGATPPRAGG